jgi:hypothetical protein
MDETPIKLYEIHNPEYQLYWSSGYEWGRRDRESEFQFDRFQEAENLLECLEWLQTHRFDTSEEDEAYTMLKNFFRKRIEDNA